MFWNFIILLKENPAIGAIITIGSGLISFIDKITPICQFIILLLGILIGLTTLIMNLIKIKKTINNKKDKTAKS